MPNLKHLENNPVNGLRPTLKPGQTLENVANKFSPWYEDCGYYGHEQRTLNPYQTDMKKSSQIAANLSEFRKSFEATMKLQELQQKTAPRHQREARSTGSVILPVLKKTLSQTSFVSFPDVNNSLKSITSEDFKDAFYDRSLFRGLEDCIDVSDVTHVVLATLGAMTTEYILEKMTKMASQVEKYRLIFWSDFQAGVDIVLKVIQAETVVGREKLCTFVESHTVDKGLGAGYQLTTNYSENFLKFSGTSKPKRYHPDNDPITKDLTTMRQVPREIKPLYSGTPISTGHIAGYLGHVPKKLSNERKIEHSLGHSRPMQNNLLLTQRGLGCVLGYSGHNPTYWTTESVERTCGCSAMTTQGAAFGPERRML